MGNVYVIGAGMTRFGKYNGKQSPWKSSYELGAEAVIAARQKIVHGAVSMVEMALHDLAEKQVVELDNERKVAMVSNLLVVLCGEAEAHPVINAGTLYA